jgi:L-lactate dehydrogenase complex protein LldG
VSDARTTILARVRQAQRTARIPVAHGASAHAGSPAAAKSHAAPTAPVASISRTAPAAVAVAQTPSREQWLDRFLEELAALGVDRHVETTADGVRARVQEIVGGRAVFAWDLDRLPYNVGSVVPGAATGASSRDVQAAAEIGVTGCDAAIVETGSLVMLAGAGKPRAASLLPPVHLCVVRRDDLRFSMGGFFEERAADIAAAAACTFITGPSRTADIELTLTLGVHGPGKVIVIVGPSEAL